jgi:ribonuclease P protein component
LRQTFKKAERLHGKKQIDALFNNGDSFFVYPFKVIYLIEEFEDKKLPQVLISVSRKNFKRAVDRNRIKRLTREAYRKNKVLITNTASDRCISISLGLIYTAKTILSYAEIEKKIILLLQRLSEQDGQTAG